MGNGSGFPSERLHKGSIPKLPKRLVFDRANYDLGWGVLILLHERLLFHRLAGMPDIYKCCSFRALSQMWGTRLGILVHLSSRI